MSPSSGPPFALWPRGQRWLLVVLTLVASVAHLARSPQAGGLGLPPGLALSLPGTPAPRPVTPSGLGQAAGDAQARADAPSLDQMAGMDMPATMPATGPDAGTHVHVGAPQASAPGLSDAAPNAPPHHTHAPDAHCPFCLTAGFALEAQPALFIFGFALRALWVAPAFLEPLLATLRHADARAPPHGSGR